MSLASMPVKDEEDKADGGNADIVPDGGWGWFIVLTTFIINALVAGTTFTLGVSIPPLWDRFEVSEAAATVVGSVMILAIMSVGNYDPPL